MKQFWKRVFKVLRPLAFMLVGLAFVLFLYSFRLSTLTDGLSVPEYQMLESTESVSAILENPINAPYKLAIWSVRLLTDNTFAIRLVSAVVSVFVIVLFYRIARQFFEKFYATLGTFLFAVSSVMLNTGRLATANVMLLALFVLMACGYALRFYKKKAVVWLFTALMIGLAIYVPGMLFFILAGGIWQFNRIKRSLSGVRPMLLVSCFVIFAAFISPIVYGLFLNPSLIKDFLGLPATFPGVVDCLKAFISVPVGVFLIAPENPVYRLGHQPTLDIFSFGMLILGGYAFLRKYSLDRTKLLAGIGLISMIWVGLSSDTGQGFFFCRFIQ